MAHLVTSSQNKNHVTSANAAHYNIGSFSDGCFALNTGDVFTASLQDANTLIIKSGDAIVCGRHWCIDSQEEVVIENGTPGYKRTDLIVARVETSPSEKITLVNYRGTDTTGTPATPSYTEGDLNNGDTVCEMPLYTVTVNGISPQTPVKLFNTIDNLSKVASNLSSVTTRTTSAESNINSLETRTSTAETNITNITTRMTTAETNIKNVGASVYPVGSIYLSTVSTNPKTLLGFGTWVQITDRFLLAAGSTYKAGATGGEASHKLTISEMPNFDKYGTSTNNSTKTWIDNRLYTSAFTQGSYYCNLVGINIGGDAAHNNMPPYLVVYVWKRTA